ncbi:hypothetical protein BS47DRAFT_1392487 [Hydnum rufescens UP504]|uniref:Uncharacterized protein n=1 Tax=Hydnum rufescens UP504 TaxID=1448309 RepID=A0A9P6DTJ2_9AGAM|nr:hypothetical protein BS47DRAFT_1392487 [Hydnum rufescens UP504]
MLKKGEYALDGPDADDDIIKAGLHVPNLLLNICGESFIAADGHHDHVVMWVNMWTPGEQQFYTLALIDVIMAELPTHWRVAQDLVEALQKQLITIPVSDTIETQNEIGEITSALAEQEKVVSCLLKQEDDLTAILKLGDPVSYNNLKKMKDHPWFEHQLNMCVLKACILAKACQRNFEAHNLTGAFRSKALGKLFIVGV